MGTEQIRTECVKVFSPGGVSCLTENVIKTNLMREYCSVSCEYCLINRTILGKMNLVAREIKFNCMRATSATILVGSDWPKGRVSIGQDSNQ